MSPILRRFCIVAVLLIPSIHWLYSNPDVPRFCQWHDDCVYMVSAKSLTDGGGYRIMSLPGEPAQTKYPPLYPLLLSLAWHIEPNFPGTLTYAAWLSWLPLPVLLWLLAAYLPRLGFQGWRLWAIIAIVALSPYTLHFTTTLLSEPLFAALLLGTLLLAERASDTGEVRLALASGLIMGLAYLARSTGIVALIALPGFFHLRGRIRLVMPFLIGMLPFVFAWMAWEHAHQVHTSDLMMMYYVDYAAYEAYNIPLHDLHIVLWKNVDGLLWALGSLLLPRVSDELFLKILAELMGVATISGLVRLAKRRLGLSYILFAAGNTCLLIAWHFPPDTRFLYPLFPLALAGFWAEMEHLAGMLRTARLHPSRDQRSAAMGVTAIAGVILASCIFVQSYLMFFHLPDAAQTFRERRPAQLAAYRWVAERTPPLSAAITTLDPLFYLATGRHALRLTVPPKLWYRDDHAAIADLYRSFIPYAREHNLEYVYHAGIDSIWGVDDNDRKTIDDAIRSNPDLEAVFQQGLSTVYKIRPQILAGAANGASEKRVDHAPDQHNP